MPLVTPTLNPIKVALTDRVFNDTRFKQEAIFESLMHRQNEAGDSMAQINVTVKYYADNAGSFGTPLHDKGMPDKSVALMADNNTVVDAADGAILVIFAHESEEERTAIANAYEQPVMLQGTFFATLRDNAPIVIGDMIRLHIAQADAMGKFA